MANGSKVWLGTSAIAAAMIALLLNGPAQAPGFRSDTALTSASGALVAQGTWHAVIQHPVPTWEAAYERPAGDDDAGQEAGTENGPQGARNGVPNGLNQPGQTVSDPDPDNQSGWNDLQPRFLNYPYTSNPFSQGGGNGSPSYAPPSGGGDFGPIGTPTPTFFASDFLLPGEGGTGGTGGAGGAGGTGGAGTGTGGSGGAGGAGGIIIGNGGAGGAGGTGGTGTGTGGTGGAGGAGGTGGTGTGTGGTGGAGGTGGTGGTGTGTGGTGGAGSTTPVPEPASVALFGAGLVGLMAATRKRRRPRQRRN